MTAFEAVGSASAVIAAFFVGRYSGRKAGYFCALEQVRDSLRFERGKFGRELLADEVVDKLEREAREDW